MWTNGLVGIVAGGLVAASGLVAAALLGSAGTHGDTSGWGLVVPVVGGIAVFVVVLRRRPFTETRTAPSVAIERRGADGPPEALPPRRTVGKAGAAFARGLRDIRRTDPGFDPVRFAGYCGMVFREAQRAWTARDVGVLRAQVTAEISGELQAQCERLQTVRHANRVEDIDIRAEIMQAWQHAGQDYVTAYIAGSVVDYTVDEVTGGLLDGSRTVPRMIAELWTFMRPAGLNPWMLTAVRSVSSSV